jgi:hypothetical protein
LARFTLKTKWTAIRWRKEISQRAWRNDRARRRRKSEYRRRRERPQRCRLKNVRIMLITPAQVDA